jgi:methylmalonyl-CoA mutase N-terminal domain/subunit
MDHPAAAPDPTFRTPSGLEVAPLYEPAFDAAAAEHWRGAVGRPGAFPFTRGVSPLVHRARLWTMRQYAGFSSAEETNLRFRALLREGQTGLSTAFDLPTQMGYDPDHPLCEGEVGRVGVSIFRLRDMEALFSGLPLGKVSVSMTINTPAIVLLAMLLAAGRRQGVALADMTGTVQNDILKEYIARGTWRFPLRPSLRLVVDVIRFCAAEVPRFHPISISGYHIREAGSTAVQEVAFTLQNGVTYVDAAARAGLSVDAFAPRLSFFFNAHNDLFEEVAKFRAARRLWAGIMRDRFGARDPRSQMLRFHAQTAGSTLTADQYQNNVVRVTVQALAAVLGGAQSLHTNSRDEALCLPTEESALLALRTQQVLAHESGVALTPDPLGGSAYVESLTDAIEAGARDLMHRLEKMGGMARAIETGFVAQEIARAAWRHQQELEAGTRIVVGVNRYRSDHETAPALFAIDPGLEARRREEAVRHRQTRDDRRAQAALAALETACRDERTPLFPPVLAAVEADVTLGEICGVFERLFGRHGGGEAAA